MPHPQIVVLKKVILEFLECKGNGMKKATTFIYEKDPRGIGKIVLNRPEVHNAFNEVMIEELTDFFKSLDSELKLILLSGKGKSFCAGADLNWMKKMKNYTWDENIEDSLKLEKMLYVASNCPIPLMARVHGAALGGGAGLLSVCDYVIAEKKTKIGFTEVRLGLVPAVISPFVIRKIGGGWAKACMLSGEIFGTHRAFHAGLIHDMVLEEEMDERVEQTVSNILRAGPNAVQECKKTLDYVLKNINEEDICDYTCRTISKIRNGDEAQEGMSALLEKRSPGWIP